MAWQTFDDAALRGESAEYAQAVDRLRAGYGFDFVAMGLTAFRGAPLKWVYSAGATSERFKRISLAPGHGIGGIVLKAGKPMLLADLDEEMDPREYSSYPIVFAEDLRSFCAVPLVRADAVVGVLLLAFRTSFEGCRAVYERCLDELGGGFCDLSCERDGYLDFAQLAATRLEAEHEFFLGHSDFTNIIGAQEEERRRISRELHDGLAQELLTVSMQVGAAQSAVRDPAVADMLEGAREGISSILDEIHNITVNLRPSTLDHFGLLSALRSQAAVFQKTYGTLIAISGTYAGERFDPALETQVYRITQEAVLNACKYSGSDRVFVEIDAAGGWMSVTVSDAGEGFDVERPVVRGTGCGLAGMRERANIIGATLEVVSGDGGTTVSLVAPMSPGADERGALK